MTEEKIEPQIDEAGEDTRVYEASFHLIPSLEETEALSAASAISKSIEAAGGKILGGEAPLLMPLAYPMKKDIERKRYTYTNAYFGWVVFETTAEAAHALKESFRTNMSILRSLLIKTTKEAGEPRKHPVHAAAVERATPSMYTAPEIAADTIPKAEQVVNVAQIDAEIEKLVTE